jgi:uridine kinase
VLSPRVIEIFGISGAGKSTFLSQIRKQRPNPGFWSSQEEFFRINQRPRIQECRFEPNTIAVLDKKLLQIKNYNKIDDGLNCNYYKTNGPIN